MTSQLNYLIAQQRIAELHQAADRARLASPRPARRRGVVILAVTAALAAAAAPTQARTFEINAQGSMVPRFDSGQHHRRPAPGPVLGGLLRPRPRLRPRARGPTGNPADRCPRQ